MKLPPIEPPPPRRMNRALVVFSDAEAEQLEAAAEARGGEPFAVTVRALSVAVAEHLVDRGRWPREPKDQRRPTAPPREHKSLCVFSDEEWAALTEAAMHRWGEPVSATVRALALAGARFMQARPEKDR